MPISHTCPCCCKELGPIRAVPDPRYGLGVVICPRCTTASVRTRHPDRVYWQHIRRLRKSLQQLVLAIIFTALATGATIGMALWLIPEITARPPQYIPPDFTNPAIPFQIGIALFIVTLSGCIARTIYAHMRFLSVIGMFVLLISVFLNIDWLISRLMFLTALLFNATPNFTIPNKDEIIRRHLAIVLLIPPFVLGMGIGVIFNSMIARGASKRVVRIRRKLRKRRSRLD